MVSHLMGEPFWLPTLWGACYLGAGLGQRIYKHGLELIKIVLSAEALVVAASGVPLIEFHRLTCKP